MDAVANEPADEYSRGRTMAADSMDDAHDDGQENSGTGVPITVLLADDHALVREGTRRLLEAEADMRVVAEAGNGQSAVEEATRWRPDVAIIDVAMPGMSGI